MTSLQRFYRTLRLAPVVGALLLTGCVVVPSHHHHPSHRPAHVEPGHRHCHHC